MSRSIKNNISVTINEGSSSKMSLPEDEDLPQDVSSVVAFSGPDGFKNRKVEVKDGYLIVSEDNPDCSDSACTSIMGEAMEEWENVYLKHRDEIINKDGFVCSPLHVIKKLAIAMEKKMHIEHFILNDPTTKGQIIFRVDILFGAIRGVGQCTKKQMARQLAAIDVYEKIQLQESQKGIRPNPMPRCALLPGWRIGFKVYSALANEIPADSRHAAYQLYRPPDFKLGKFTATCRVEKARNEAKSDHPWLAKKLAAKDAFEKVTGHEFPYESTLTGSEVIGFPQMKLLGFHPKVTNLKRKWMMQYRVKNTQVVLPSTEPDDGEMEDVEEEVQMQQSKRFKLNEFKETLKVEVPRELAHTAQKSRQVTFTPVENIDNQPKVSRSFTVIKQELESDDEDDDDRLVIHIEENEMLDD